MRLAPLRFTRKSNGKEKSQKDGAETSKPIIFFTISLYILAARYYKAAIFERMSQISPKMSHARAGLTPDKRTPEYMLNKHHAYESQK
jgi:hypothetical protein